MTFKAETADGMHIGKAAEKLGVTPVYLRLLERKGLIPAPRRDVFGRVYSEFDIALLKSMGIGSKPTKLRSPEEALEASRG